MYEPRLHPQVWNSIINKNTKIVIIHKYLGQCNICWFIFLVSNSKYEIANYIKVPIFIFTFEKEILPIFFSENKNWKKKLFFHFFIYKLEMKIWICNATSGFLLWKMEMGNDKWQIIWIHQYFKLLIKALHWKSCCIPLKHLVHNLSKVLILLCIDNDGHT